jgi:hypothetical protein
MYKQYSELDTKRKKEFDAFLTLYNNVEKLNTEIDKLVSARKAVASKIIAYLRMTHYDGVKTSALIAYMKEYVGSPSFIQVMKRVGNRISEEDKRKLNSSYRRLLEKRERTINLVVKKEGTR